MSQIDEQSRASTLIKGYGYGDMMLMRRLFEVS